MSRTKPLLLSGKIGVEMLKEDGSSDEEGLRSPKLSGEGVEGDRHETGSTTDETPGASEDGKEEPVVDETADKHRMWAAISFAFMLIVVGIPLWWKTTEVFRAPLPYDRISALDPMGLQISMNIKVYTDYPSKANEVIQELESIFELRKLFRISMKPFKINLDEVSYESLEAAEEFHPKTPGDLLLAQVPVIPGSPNNILVSNKRIIYFTPNAKVSKVGEIICQWMLLEDDLQEKIASLVSPGENSTDDKDSQKRLRASPSYLVVFTVINSDPETISLVWDIKTAINAYINPLLNQIRHIGEHKAKSQWLYMVDLGETPTKTPTGHTLSFAQLPHIITPLEKKLGSGISKEPCVHMILYTPGCDGTPLSFLSEEGENVLGMISPQWGAIQILNPTKENCENRTSLVPASHKVMGVFVSQFHTLLGIREREPIKDVELEKMTGPLLRDWELDVLYRLRVVDQVTSSSLTLQSLAKLLGEISNIVINEEVAESVREAVEAVEDSVQKLRSGQLEEALTASSDAYKYSETAFSHPSLLALLYFPDDQKYAVYIPLFLPIMIPVLMSLKNIYNWTVKRKAHVKAD